MHCNTPAVIVFVPFGSAHYRKASQRLDFCFTRPLSKSLYSTVNTSRSKTEFRKCVSSPLREETYKNIFCADVVNVQCFGLFMDLLKVHQRCFFLNEHLHKHHKSDTDGFTIITGFFGVESLIAGIFTLKKHDRDRFNGFWNLRIMFENRWTGRRWRELSNCHRDSKMLYETSFLARNLLAYPVHSIDFRAKERLLAVYINNIYVYQDDKLRTNSAIPYLGFILPGFTVNINNQPRIHFFGHIWASKAVAMATSNREENHIFPTCICHLFAAISRVAFGSLVKMALENSLIEKYEKFIGQFHRNHKI